MSQGQPNEKLHTACDECRTRKLKCSGETPRCSRCQRENIDCIYSPQKQMGRPRKRRREGEVVDVVEPLADVNARANALDDFNLDGEIANFGVLPLPQHQNHFYLNDSPPVLNGTPSLDFDGTDSFGISPRTVVDLSTEPPIDPSLWDMSVMASLPDDDATPAPLAPCNCLSLMYLTLTELQSVTSFAFPQIIIPLRKAMGVLSDIIHCSQCPKESFSAIQNIQSVVSLFKAVVERFHKVLLAIDKEAAQLELTGQKKPYRIGDNSPALMHLHTGTLDCPMGFNIEIEAKDWKRLVKTALKTEIYGNGSNPRPLLQLLKEVTERQKKWHEDKEYHDAERRRLFGDRNADGARGNCEALGADQIRRIIDNLNWE